MTVKQIQHLLAYLGYDPGDIDGLPGPRTTAAVREFQGDYGGIAQDGDAGEQTQKALRDAVAYNKFKPPDTAAGEASGTGTFWDEIQYFARAEFACQCKDYNGPYCDGFPVEPDETLVRLADRVRGHFGRPANRTSGIRCPQHNRDSGGVSNSKHMRGKALDFWVSGVSGAQLLSYVQAQPETNYAYIVDGNVVHMDVD